MSESKKFEGYLKTVLSVLVITWRKNKIVRR